jgi:hypothetical protein
MSPKAALVVDLDPEAFDYVQAWQEATPEEIPEPGAERGEAPASLYFLGPANELLLGFPFREEGAPPSFRIHRLEEWWRDQLQSVREGRMSDLDFQARRAWLLSQSNRLRKLVHSRLSDDLLWLDRDPLGGCLVRRSRSSEFKITAPGGAGGIPQGFLAQDSVENASLLPAPLQGLLSLLTEGPKYVKQASDYPQTITLLEAITQRFNLTPKTVRCGDLPSRQGGATFSVLGPNQDELKILEQNWSKIVLKGKVHLNRQRLAFLGATMATAFTARYKGDNSPTNRSSIQLLVEGPRKMAILTGDGRPESLADSLRQRSPQHAPCVVFKAAHHGSDHNIRVNEKQNEVLSWVNPRHVWVSCDGSNHPSPTFLSYILSQRNHGNYDVLLTNSNQAASLLRSPYVKLRRKGMSALL